MEAVGKLEFEEWKKKIEDILKQREWDIKEWHRAIGLNQWLLEGILKEKVSVTREQLEELLKITKMAKKKKLLRFSEPIILAVWTHKGGTGKSTLSTNIAYELGNRGYNTLCIDTDSQADMSSVLFPDYLKYPDKNFYNAFVMHYDIKREEYIFHTMYDNLDIVPGSGQLENLENILAPFQEEQRIKIVDMCLKTILEENYYDFIIIDRDKNSGLFSNTILSKTRYVLSPMEVAMFAVKSIPTIEEHIKSVCKYNAKLKWMGIVMNKVDLRRKNHFTETKKLIEELAPKMLFQSFIRNEANIEKSQRDHLPLGVFSKNSLANSQMIELVDEILNRLD